MKKFIFALFIVSTFSVITLEAAQSPSVAQEAKPAGTVFVPAQDDKTTWLHSVVVQVDDPECVAAVIKIYPTFLYEKDASGNLPLHLAAQCGFVGVVRCLLLEHKKNPPLGMWALNARNNQGKTAADLALDGEHSDAYQAIARTTVTLELESKSPVTR